MGLLDRIPLPGTGFEGIGQGMDLMNKFLNIPMERQLKEQEIKRNNQLYEQSQQKLPLELERLQSEINQGRQVNPLKLDLLKAQIENMKASAKKKGQSKNNFEIPTTAFVTQNQKMVQNIENVIPQLEELAASGAPSQLFGQVWNPEKSVSYEGKAATIADTLIGALGLPKTNESIALINKMVRRGALERDKAYKERIKNLINELNERKKRSISVLKNSNAISSDEGEKELVYNQETGDFE